MGKPAATIDLGREHGVHDRGEQLADSSPTPVVTSDRSALPEVAGDAALLVDPESPEAIADGMRRALRDDTYRAELRRRGFDRARAFRWEVTARQTVAVYREALAQH